MLRPLPLAVNPIGVPGASPAHAGLTRPHLELGRLWLEVVEGATATGESGPDSGAPQGPPPEELDRIAALVVLAQRGDAAAFGQLYERYVDTVYRYIYVRVGSVHTAQDLTSETFLKALRSINGFTWQGKDIAAWFVTIARNVVNDHAKSSRFRMEVTTADMMDADQQVDAPDGEVLTRMRDAQLLDAIKTLKPEQAECIMLRFVEGLSLAETAAVMDKKENAVKQLQLRAVRSLQRALDGVEL